MTLTEDIKTLSDMDNMQISVSHEILTCTRRLCSSSRGNDLVQSCFLRLLVFFRGKSGL